MSVQVDSRLPGKGRFARPIEAIADERVARCREVNPDLVRAARLDRNLDERGLAAMLDEPHPASRPLALGIHACDRPEHGVGDGTDGKVENRLPGGKAPLTIAR